MSNSLSNADLKAIRTAVERVDELRLEGVKSTLELTLDETTAKVYHMGKNNPVVRVDIKMEGK